MNFLKITSCLVLSSITLNAQDVDDRVRQGVEAVYSTWRTSMIRKDHKSWVDSTAYHRKTSIYNRIVSSYLPYPKAIFDIPVAPPAIKGLKAINVNQKGNTAIATYFGKIDFGIGGEPTENLMVLYFVGEDGKWKYDTADFINLTALPDVRSQMLAGNYSYAKQADFMATGKLPDLPKLVKERGYMAKVYSYCPGREVKVDINNGASKHRFQNDKAAEVVIGGLADRINTITFTTKTLPGGKGDEPINIRVFLMSQLDGINPVNVFEYSITLPEAKAGKRPDTSKSTTINITADHVKKIMTRE